MCDQLYSTFKLFVLLFAQCESIKIENESGGEMPCLHLNEWVVCAPGEDVAGEAGGPAGSRLSALEQRRVCCEWRPLRLLCNSGYIYLPGTVYTVFCTLWPGTGALVLEDCF